MRHKVAFFIIKTKIILQNTKIKILKEFYTDKSRKISYSHQILNRQLSCFPLQIIPPPTKCPHLRCPCKSAVKKNSVFKTTY